MILLIYSLLFSISYGQGAPPTPRPINSEKQSVSGPGAQQPPVAKPDAVPVPDANAGPAPVAPPDDLPMNNGDQASDNQFQFDPTTGRDPFKIPKGVRVEREPKKAAVGGDSRDPLQRVNLDKVKVLGIIWNIANPRALIYDDDSKSTFTIHKNTRLGPNQGIVTDIREGSVVVLETFTNDDGDDVKIPRVLSIRK